MGDLGSIPGLERSPGEGKGYPLQYSGLKNSTDYIVHGVTKSQTRLSNFHFSFSTWKITNGLVDFLFQGLFEAANGTFMIKDGQVDLLFNGFAPNAKGNWFVQNGEVQTNYVGPVVVNGQKFTVDKGLVK